MMKEAALFTVSSGVLFYFLSPLSEEPAKVPDEVTQETESAKPEPAKIDDSWGYEGEEDNEDEEFVFGEPLLSDDDGEEDYHEESDQSYDELSNFVASNNKSSAQTKSSKSASSSTSYTESPQGNQPGSKNNPVVFGTQNRANDPNATSNRAPSRDDTRR